MKVVESAGNLVNSAVDTKFTTNDSNAELLLLIFSMMSVKQIFQ